ncbi:MAG: ribosome biogenesis GTP-binding protein YihA/YsxC [Roseburia sp.]|nr:ribosome biogenesis GTP-binding protein YihA/YsxC [Roseburia sp.]
MKVKSACFVKSFTDPDAVHDLEPQICVAGRSNCGKSTLLNMLMGAKLCKTSQTPGRTRLINVFRVEAEPMSFYFTDLPGYGFHSAQKAQADDWSERTDRYFRNGKAIAQTLCLMDIRRDPSEHDKILINYLRDLEVPFTVVTTKADKLSRAQIGNAKIKIAAALGLARDNIIVTSSHNGSGKDALLDRIENILAVRYVED